MYVYIYIYVCFIVRTTFKRNKFSLSVPTHPVNVIANSIEPTTMSSMAGSELRLSIPSSLFS